MRDSCDLVGVSDGSRLAAYQVPFYIFLACALWYCSFFALSLLFCFCFHALVGAL